MTVLLTKNPLSHQFTYLFNR